MTSAIRSSIQEELWICFIGTLAHEHIHKSAANRAVVVSLSLTCEHHDETRFIPWMDSSACFARLVRSTKSAYREHLFSYPTKDRGRALRRHNSSSAMAKYNRHATTIERERNEERFKVTDPYVIVCIPQRYIAAPYLSYPVGSCLAER